MIRHRTDEQVIASAVAIDTLLDAGIDRDVVDHLLEVRAAWQRTGDIRQIVLTPTLLDAIHDPAVAEWDGVFAAAVRRRLRNRPTRHLA